MNPTAARVYRTDPLEGSGARGAGTSAIAGAASLPPGVLPEAVARPGPARVAASAPAGPADLPLPVFAAVGERLAAVAGRAQRALPAEAAADLGRLENFGVQLQELAHVVSRAQQLRQEGVDLGLALLQSVAEWSTEAARQGVELHGPACSQVVQANPAALKHLLDLMVEHALQQGRSVRLLVEVDGADHGAESGVRMVAAVSSEPASQSPARDTLAWQLLQWLARGLGLRVEREAVARGERVAVWLPRG